ncbi:MAG: hypothetical protein FJ102_12065 [Deltaproteobacteria bacterium]|nr:hypothetical protein [Deltaproteobacteria bacterium]
MTTLLLIVSAALAQSRGLKFGDEITKVKIQKPEIAIVMTQQNLAPRYDLELKESFLPKVVESVEKKPF